MSGKHPMYFNNFIHPGTDKLLSSVLNDEECDATDDDSSIADNKILKIITVQILL
jgi:hypothetical protein